MGSVSAARFSNEGPGWGYAMDGDTVTVAFAAGTVKSPKARHGWVYRPVS